MNIRESKWQPLYINVLPQKERLLTCIFVSLAILISWQPFLHDTANLMIDESIKNGAIVFAIARALNGIISVLQTIQADVIIVSVTIGELLDPLNDLVENFSDLMTLALGSLALQKLLLIITSNDLFSWLVTIIGLILLISRFFFEKLIKFATIAFLTLLFIRFLFSFVVISNNYFDNAITIHHQEPQIQALNLTKTKLESYENLKKLNPNRFFDEASQYIELSVTALINLIAVFVLKTIISPLLFWWLFYRGFVLIKRIVV